MEKFEFFPVKCRTARAAEIYKRYVQNYKENQSSVSDHSTTKHLKSKVYSTWILKLNLNYSSLRPNDHIVLSADHILLDPFG